MVSVTAVKDIKKNDIFTEKNIFPLRPYNGEYKVKDYKSLLEKGRLNIKAGTQIKKICQIKRLKSFY